MIFLRAFIFVREDTNGILATVQTIRDVLASHTVTVADIRTIPAHGAWPEGPGLPTMAQTGDFAISVGGDGTLLATVSAVRAKLPILGVNLGRLGFLTDLSPLAVETELSAILAGQYRSETRLLIQGGLDSAPARWRMALNDIVLEKADGGRMIDIETWIDGRFVCIHRADGVIVATPTGSTAYALSCGGPILHPELEALLILPISPHNLSERPLVIASSSEIELRVPDRAAERCQVNWDGQESLRLNAGQSLRISRAEQRVQLVHPIDYDPIAKLRDKLRWGGQDS
ncbi:MAG: NAD(+)/NADH kinase [Gammaproteobacteria bacterium]